MEDVQRNLGVPGVHTVVDAVDCGEDKTEEHDDRVRHKPTHHLGRVRNWGLVARRLVGFHHW